MTMVFVLFFVLWGAVAWGVLVFRGARAAARVFSVPVCCVWSLLLRAARAVADRIRRWRQNRAETAPARAAAKAEKARAKAIPEVPPFVAIDFETANACRDSACALGLVVFRNGEPVERKYWLVNPKCEFLRSNIAIHGITPAEVRRAPHFGKLWSQVKPYLKRAQVVGYSMFDAEVLQALAARFNFSVRLDYADVCALSRSALYGLKNYRLPTVADHLGIPGLDHHNALSDAEICGRIFARLLVMKREAGRPPSERLATPRQIEYIRSLGGEVPPRLTMDAASSLIDSLVEARKTQRTAEKSRAKEENELMYLAARMGQPDYTPPRHRSPRLRHLGELQRLLIAVMEDGVLEPAEASDLQNWLEAHKVLENDFADALRLLPAIIEGTATPDMAEAVYAALLDCLATLRARSAV